MKGSAVWGKGRSKPSRKSAGKSARKSDSDKNNRLSARAAAAQLLAELLKGQGNLSSLLEPLQNQVADDQQALLQELAYGSARHFHTLEFLATELLAKPLRNKDRDVYALILLGIYQLRYLRVPAHAAINLTVESVDELQKSWATGLVNGVLRNYQRQFMNDEDASSDSLVAGDADASSNTSNPQAIEEFFGLTKEVTQQARFSHPQWMIDTIRDTWKDDWQDVLQAANVRPPLSLRVNTAAISIGDYMQQLSANDIAAQPHPVVATAIVLEKAQSVHQLPGFVEGKVSVQDASAQLAVELLRSVCQPPDRADDGSGANPRAGGSEPIGHCLPAVSGELAILDACAAPGGKTGHLLEVFPDAHVTALDVSKKRLQRVKENLDRLQATDRVKLLSADAAAAPNWSNGQQFDIVLVDAPCSGSGVIRRQPDIKLLRKGDDVAELARLQHKIMDSLWPLVKPGGKLLYVTCSIFRQENDEQMQQFLKRHENVKEIALQPYLDARVPQYPIEAGWQVLTGTLSMDGFYYCLLEKKPPA